ncbi:reverse transcriptase domain-containing protein [Bacillus altitudinis]|uniref:reverse transcriptase domain-containing protein n=1 Tax=Bacillus altitudinis TaxID=293387 RepID=UPI0024A88201|nr:reverse transcriptase domain-containing protein [Bacillus altitudinis]MDI6647931.1 reverse transcriptase domain-containing protein [Bacillus altitudinis]MDI6662555.1 reverse transcriptase domain-containing protein [Bacillus altitudinis]
MRKKIICELANEFEKNEKDILSLLHTGKNITPYKTHFNNKGREIINKDHITKEEQIILSYYKLLLNKLCAIRFPNRSYTMTELMNLMPNIHKYKSYTIFRFDIKNFFYKIDPKKSLGYIKKTLNLRSNEFVFLNNYTESQNNLIPGLGLHNSLVEICGYHFDLTTKKIFRENLLYYSRYVDDCILVFDEIITEEVIKGDILKLLKCCFGDKIELNLNESKTKYVNSNWERFEIDYLGYTFQKDQSEKLKFGISEKKLEKYKGKIDNIVLEYCNSNNVDVLSLKLELLFKRIVYLGNRKNNNKYRWQVRGLSENYKELKRFMKKNDDFSRITKNTQNFFKKEVQLSFRKRNIQIPAKINNQIKNKKFISSFINNRALLLHKKIGLKHNDLKKKLKILTDENVDGRSYSDLASEFLIKIK